MATAPELQDEPVSPPPAAPPPSLIDDLVLEPALSLEFCQNWIPRLGLGQLSLVLLLAGVFVAASLFPLHHSDLWGHLSFGRWMVEHGQLPTSDPFGIAPAADRFQNPAWLSQLLGYLLYEQLGGDGLSLAQALLMMSTVGLVTLACWRRGCQLGIACLAGLACFLISLPVAGVLRPQLLATALAAALLVLLSSPRQGWSNRLAVGLLMALWCNLHGSVPLGLALLLAAALGQTLDWVRTGRSELGENSPARSLGGTWSLVLAGLLGACCQPHGLYALLDLFRFTGHPLLSQLNEWRPLTPASLGGALFFVSLLATGILLRISPRRWSACDVLLVVAGGAAVWSANRMLAWWAIVLPWVLAPHLQALVSAARPRRRLAHATLPCADDAAAPRRGWVGLLVVIAALIWSPASRSLITGQLRPMATVVSPATPFFVGEQVEARELAGRFWAPLDWADYCLWQGQGRLQPLLYTHVHLADPQVWSDYQELSRGGTQWLEVAQRRGLRWLVLDNRRNGQLYLNLEQQPSCRVRYQDEQATLVEIVTTPPSASESSRSLAENRSPIGKRFAP